MREISWQTLSRHIRMHRTAEPHMVFLVRAKCGHQLFVHHLLCLVLCHDWGFHSFVRIRFDWGDFLLRPRLDTSFHLFLARLYEFDRQRNVQLQTLSLLARQTGPLSESIFTRTNFESHRILRLFARSQRHRRYRRYHARWTQFINYLHGMRYAKGVFEIFEPFCFKLSNQIQISFNIIVMFRLIFDV